MDGRKKRHRSSPENAERLRTLLDALDSPVIAVNDEGNVTEVNSAGLSLLGLDKERDAVGRHFVETYIAHESHTQLTSKLRGAFMGLHAGAEVAEAGVSTRTGDVKQVTLRITSLRGKEGSSQGAMVQVKERTKTALPHNQAGTTSSESIPPVQPDALAQVLEASGSPLFALDRNGNIREWNSMAADVAGLPRCEVRGKPFVTRLIHKSHRPRVQHVVQQACNGSRAPRLSQIQLCRKSGQPIEVILTVGPLPTKIGSEACVAIGAFEDVTWLSTRCEEASREAQRTEKLLQEANAPMFAVDLQGNVEEWNLRMATVTGLSKSSVMGEPVMDNIEEHSVSHFRDALLLAGAGKLGQVFELTMREAGECAGTVTLLAGLSPRFGPDNIVVGAFCVTQVAPRTGQIFGPQGGAELQAKAKSHVMNELRSPLLGIIGLSNSLSMDDSAMQRHLKLIHKSAERVLEMIQNLVDYWGLSEGAADISLEIIDMRAFVIDALAKCEQARDKRGKPLLKESVKIIRNIKEDIPKVEADPHCIAQLLFHLLSNALRFTQTGQVQVTAAAINKDSAVEVIVEDTGIGIAQECVDRIFKPYQQEDSSQSPGNEGIGLGLAICREVVKKHGGSIHVQSIKGRGSTFHVTLPCMQASMQEKTPKSKKQTRTAMVTPTFDMTDGNIISDACSPRGSRTPTFEMSDKSIGSSMRRTRKGFVDDASIAGSEKSVSHRSRASFRDSPTVSEVGVGPRVPVVMSVDDDPADQEIIRAALEPSGFKLVKCMSGAECFEHLDNGGEKPDMILLDLVMPGLSGFEVLEVHRKKYPMEHTPIIMVSAKKMASSVVQALELGCTDWINKPFNKNELLARIRAHLHTRTAITRSLACLPAPVDDSSTSESESDDSQHDDVDDDASSDSEKGQSDDEQPGDNQVTSRGDSSVSSSPGCKSTVIGGPMDLFVALNTAQTNQTYPTAVASPQVAYRNAPAHSNEGGADVTTESCSRCVAALFAVVTTLTDCGGMEFVAGLFSEFNTLSRSHGCAHTEMIGTCYIALTESSPGETSHVDSLFRLALEMEEAVQKHQHKLLPGAPVQFSAGIHAETQAYPISHSENASTPRSSRFFGAAVHLAKVLGENARYGHVVLSRSARSCLHGDMEAQARSRGFSLVEVHKLPPRQGRGDSDHFCLVSNNMSISKPPGLHGSYSSAGVSLSSWDMCVQEDVPVMRMDHMQKLQEDAPMVWMDQMQELQVQLAETQQKLAFTTGRLTATEQRMETLEKSGACTAAANASDISKLRDALDAQIHAGKSAMHALPCATSPPYTTPSGTLPCVFSEPAGHDSMCPPRHINESAGIDARQLPQQARTLPQRERWDGFQRPYWDTPLPQLPVYPVGRSPHVADTGSWDWRSSPWMSTSTSLAASSGLGLSFSSFGLR